MHNLRMPDVNLVIIAGNLTRDPVFRKTTNGTPVTNFWLACNRKFKDNNGQWRENVCYVGVVAWYKLAESCSENLHRGSIVIVEGELQSRSIRTEESKNRNIIEIKARRIQFLNRIENVNGLPNEEDTAKGKESESFEEEEPAAQNTSASESTPTNNEVTDENTPLSGEYDFGYQDIKI
jgi:single-strand DNA-binding protein